MTITYPLMTVLDDSGAIVTGATVAITSVKDKAGTDIATPGATVNLSGANVSVDYDAEFKGEAWVVLTVSKVGSTFTNFNAAPAFFLARDSGRVNTTYTAVQAAANYLTGVVAASPTPTASGFTVTLDKALDAATVVADFTGQYLTFCAGSKNAVKALAIATAVITTVNGVTSLALTFAAPFPVTPAAGDPVTISA